MNEKKGEKKHKKPLKIIVNGDNASEKMGGEATKPIRLFRGYRSLGHSVVMITHERCKDELKKIFTHKEFSDIYFVKDTRLQKILFWAYRNLKLPVRSFIPFISQIELREMVRSKKLESYQFIHQATPISPALPSLLFNMNQRICIGPLAVLPDYPENFIRKSIIKKIKTSLETQLIYLSNLIFPGKNQADVVFCDNLLTSEAIYKYCGKNDHCLITLNNAVEDFWFDGDVYQPPKIPTFIFAGRLIDWKQVDMIVDAAGLLDQVVKLIIVGDGPEYNNIRKRCENYRNIDLTMVGWKNRIDIRNYYVRSTAAVSLALKESGGTSVKEAMASGVPLIVSNWGGHTSRIFEDMGFLVCPSSREQMIKQTAFYMKQVFEDQDLARERAERAREYAYENMRWISKIQYFEKCLYSLK